MNDKQVTIKIKERIKELKTEGITKVSVLDFMFPSSQVERILDRMKEE